MYVRKKLYKSTGIGVKIGISPALVGLSGCQWRM